MQLFQQGTHVVVVAFLVAELGAVISSVHAGQAAKGIHAHAGIVGQRGQACVLRRKPCLGQGVFDKGAEGLLGLAHAQIGLAHQLHAQGRKHGLQLGQLAAVVGC